MNCPLFVYDDSLTTSSSAQTSSGSSSPVYSISSLEPMSPPSLSQTGSQLDLDSLDSSKWEHLCLFKQTVASVISGPFYDDLVGEVVNFLPDDGLIVGLESQVHLLDKPSDKHEPKCFGKPGDFRSVNGVAYSNKTGRLFVCDCFNHRIQVLDEEGKFLFAFGGKSLYGPFQISLNPKQTTLAIGSMWSDDVCLFTVEGKLLKVIRAGWKSPTGVAWIGDDELVVADAGTKQVWIIEASSGLTKGQLRVLSAQWSNPRQVAVDLLRGFVYVSDSGNNRVEQFDLKSRRHLQSITELDSPCGLAVDECSGRVFVAEFEKKVISVFDSDCQKMNEKQCESQPHSVCFLSHSFSSE